MASLIYRLTPPSYVPKLMLPQELKNLDPTHTYTHTHPYTHPCEEEKKVPQEKCHFFLQMICYRFEHLQLAQEGGEEVGTEATPVIVTHY